MVDAPQPPTVQSILQVPALPAWRVELEGTPANTGTVEKMVRRIMGDNTPRQHHDRQQSPDFRVKSPPRRMLSQEELAEIDALRQFIAPASPALRAALRRICVEDEKRTASAVERRQR